MTDLGKAPARESGFYWVRWEEEGGDDWQPAEWDADDRRWWLIGLDVSVVDAMDAIGPRILPPGEQEVAALDTLSQLSAQHDERITALRAGRDELVAVLRWCAGRGCIDGGMTDAEQRATMARVNAVIAKVGAP